MIALVAVGSALTGTGIALGGSWGMFLIVLGEIANTIWLVATFVKWWRRASDRTRLIIFATTVAYVIAWFVIRVAAGPLAAWVLGLGFVGYIGTVTGALMTTGYLAAHHAKVTQLGIASGEIKEVTR